MRDDSNIGLMAEMFNFVGKQRESLGMLALALRSGGVSSFQLPKLHRIGRVPRIRNQQSLNHFAIENRSVNDLFNVFLLHAAVPNSFGINYHRNAVLAGVEAAGVVCPNDVRKPALLQFGFECVAHFFRAFCVAAALRMTRLSFIEADEDVALVAAHIIHPES